MNPIVRAKQHLLAAVDNLAAAAKRANHGDETQLDCTLALFETRKALAAVQQVIDRDGVQDDAKDVA